MKTKILIVKLGYSETLDPEVGRIPSLGDIVRTTPILWALKEKYPDSDITWLVDKESEPLLHDNHLIDRVLVWDDFVGFQLMREKFDVLINLEKIAGICALSDMIDAWVKYGFRFDSIRGVYHAYERGLNFLEYIKARQDSNKMIDCWQKILIEMMGVKWSNQDYVIDYKPKIGKMYDIGLNYQVGSKWPTKAMNRERWDDLKRRLNEEGYSVSWQQGLSDLREYMDWIGSQKIIITNDSLGLHLALGLKKNVVALFGATSETEVYMYNRALKVSSPVVCSLMPCYASQCKNDKFCMDNIDLDDVVKCVKHFLPGKADLLKAKESVR